MVPILLLHHILSSPFLWMLWMNVAWKASSHLLGVNRLSSLSCELLPLLPHTVRSHMTHTVPPHDTYRSHRLDTYCSYTYDTYRSHTYDTPFTHIWHIHMTHMEHMTYTFLINLIYKPFRLKYKINKNFDIQLNVYYSLLKYVMVLTLSNKHILTAKNMLINESSYKTY